MTPIVVMTKIDQCEDAATYQRKAESLQPGLLVEAVNGLEVDSLEPLSIWCRRGKTVALVGSSGVGKSTIVNTLLEKPAQQTGGIREDDSKGRHTTSSRSMHQLKAGGWLIDTPGMRELRLIDVETGVNSVFDEVTSLVAACRFSDCQHESEPGCAIQEAIAEGRLDPDRLRRFKKLEREQQRNSETIAERRSRVKAFHKMAANAQRGKKNRRDGR